MQAFRDNLICNLEYPESKIDSRISEHFRVHEKIEKKNRKKAEAAINEDFELAVKYRN